MNGAQKTSALDLDDASSAGSPDDDDADEDDDADADEDRTKWKPPPQGWESLPKDESTRSPRKPLRLLLEEKDDEDMTDKPLQARENEYSTVVRNESGCLGANTSGPLERPKRGRCGQEPLRDPGRTHSGGSRPKRKQDLSGAFITEGLCLSNESNGAHAGHAGIVQVLHVCMFVCGRVCC